MCAMYAYPDAPLAQTGASALVRLRDKADVLAENSGCAGSVFIPISCLLASGDAQIRLYSSR
jgi:hypothetical protein